MLEALLAEKENVQMFQFIPSLRHEIKVIATYMHGNVEDGLMTALATKT